MQAESIRNAVRQGLCRHMAKIIRTARTRTEEREGSETVRNTGERARKAGRKTGEMEVSDGMEIRRKNRVFRR